MIISVNGHLIDTDKIYHIDPIIGDNCWRTNGRVLNHSGYEFTIHFLNEKSLTIYLSGDDFFGTEDWWECNYDKPDLYIIRRDMIKDEVQKIRDFIVKHWNPKSDMPSISFTTVKI